VIVQFARSLRRSISGAGSRSVEQGDEAPDFCEWHNAAVTTMVDRVRTRPANGFVCEAAE
jgi:hypothetical protein